MTRVVRNAALLCVAGILVASVAFANVPDPTKCSLQSAYLAVEGSTGGLPDNCSDGRCGNFLITVRDFANNVIAGSSVVVDFVNCPDIQVSCNQQTAATQQTFLAVASVVQASDRDYFPGRGEHAALRKMDCIILYELADFRGDFTSVPRARTRFRSGAGALVPAH